MVSLGCTPVDEMFPLSEMLEGRLKHTSVIRQCGFYCVPRCREGLVDANGVGRMRSVGHVGERTVLRQSIIETDTDLVDGLVDRSEQLLLVRSRYRGVVLDLKWNESLVGRMTQLTI